MTRSESEAKARVLGALLRGGSPNDEPSAERVEMDARRLVERAKVEPRVESQRSTVRWTLVASLVGGIAAVGAALLSLRPSEEERVVWVTEGSARVDGEFVRARTEPVTLRFSEGSTVELAPDAEVRVSELERSGARLTVLRGRVSSRIVHRDATHYRVQAGPYEVSVIGTEFQTEWTPSTQALRITMVEGTVGVTGAGIAGSVTLTEGQRLEASGQTREWAVVPVDAIAEESVAPVQEVGAEEPGPTAETSTTREPEARVARPKEVESWATAIAKGDFARVLSEARAMGVERCLAVCAAKELRALGDAARYRGDFAMARGALGALRERVPSERSRASYLLGTLGEAQGDPRGALGWYRKSIAENPAGPVAAEARAGALRVTLALEGRSAARPLAEEYLRLYPDGVGAETARRILNR